MEKCQTMTELLAKNKAAVDELVEGVFRCLEDTRKSRDQINALELVSRRIDKIVICYYHGFDSNQHVVNGAIEAARAGEFGKGFVVVSTDIRNLAHDSSENAERIKDMVKAVQDQIGAVRRDLENIAANAATTEVEKTKAITGNLVIMEGDTAEVLKGNNAIAADSARIMLSLVEVKKGVDQIAAAAAEAEQAATQAASAATQQSQGAEEWRPPSRKFPRWLTNCKARNSARRGGLRLTPDPPGPSDDLHRSGIHHGNSNVGTTRP